MNRTSYFLFTFTPTNKNTSIDRTTGALESRMSAHIILLSVHLLGLQGGFTVLMDPFLTCKWLCLS